VAHALAINVFPVPGGPYKRIPFQGFLEPVNIYGYLIGRVTASFNAVLAACRPAISSHLTFGFFETIVSSNAYLNWSFSLFYPPPDFWSSTIITGLLIAFLSSFSLPIRS